MASKVLVVDDHAGVRAMLWTALSTEQLSVEWEASSVAEALSVASAVRPDAIVLDQQMPDGLGTSILPELREMLPSARIVVFSSDMSIQQLALDLGADGWVGKGDPIDVLISSLAG
jgi:DNA-binding NarL/FixJ family response regulator